MAECFFRENSKNFLQKGIYKALTLSKTDYPADKRRRFNI